MKIVFIIMLLVVLFGNSQSDAKKRPNNRNQNQGSCSCKAPSLTMQCEGEWTNLTNDMVKTKGRNMRHHCNCDCPDMSCICPAAPSCPSTPDCVCEAAPSCPTCPAAPDCICNYPAPTDAAVVQDVETPYQGGWVSGVVGISTSAVAMQDLGLHQDTLFVVHHLYNMLYAIDLTDTTQYKALQVNGLVDPRGMVRLTPAGMTLVITDYGSPSLHFVTLARSNNGWEIESQKVVALRYAPFQVSRDGDNLLVAASGNQIRVVNDSGHQLTAINPKSTSQVYKAVPACQVPTLCYIVMDNSQKLVLISDHGQEKATYTGSPGQKNFIPQDMILVDGSVYVADHNTARIQRLNLDLTWQGDVINLSDEYSRINRLSLNEMTRLLYVSGLTKAKAGKYQVSVISL